MRARVSRTIIDWLSGTHLFQCPNEMDAHGYGEAGKRLVNAIHGTKQRKDGSVTVNLTDGADDVLRDLVEAMECSVRDDIRPDNPSALGEYNAARALLNRQLGRS